MHSAAPNAGLGCAGFGVSIMTKIPVGATIAQAYGFVFGRFFTLLGIVWLSWLVIAVGALFLMRQATVFSTAITMRDFSAIGSVLLVLIPFYLITLILILMQYMGFTEQALGLRKGSPYFYFKLGQPLWLLVLSFLLVILVFIGVGVAMGIAIALLTGASVAIGGNIAGGLIVSLLAVVLYCAFIYLTVRLTFLLAPAVVAENRIGLKRAWALGKGNFWRMFVIILAVMLPIFIVMGILMFTFLFRGMPLPPAGADPDAVGAISRGGRRLAGGHDGTDDGLRGTSPIPSTSSSRCCSTG